MLKDPEAKQNTRTDPGRAEKSEAGLAGAKKGIRRHLLLTVGAAVLAAAVIFASTAAWYERTAKTGSSGYPAESWDFGAAQSKYYYVVFTDEDGTTVLQPGGYLAWGETPEYTGELPAKAATEQYTYVFAGWTVFGGENVSDELVFGQTVAQHFWSGGVLTPEIGPVTGADGIVAYRFTAEYAAAVREYPVVFLDEDGSSVLQSGNVAYGDTPVYSGQTPVKAATEQYVYTFSGWTPALAPVTGPATYTAVYTATEIIPEPPETTSPETTTSPEVTTASPETAASPETTSAPEVTSSPGTGQQEP